MNNLKSLSQVFEHRLIRIPDYQRGYAWEKHQLDYFWEDLVQLSEGRIHYTGVISLEPVSSSAANKWREDAWIIEGKGYAPFFVVDGQQRLTTSVILVQAIIEAIPVGAELSYQTREEIRAKYIEQVGTDGLRRSFLFGYEKDDPSEQFLRTKIFESDSRNGEYVDTLYTRNLAFAKRFFLGKLKDMSFEQVEELFHKLTQRLKFNLYEIDDEIDVNVTFETMNNRGKPLSNLELLKNRLIYLSTLFRDHAGHQVLRDKVNDTWKSIYEYLGKNPDNPLSDNGFLRHHWIMYFQYTRVKGDDYIRFLLDEKFTARNATHHKNSLPIDEVMGYVESLQESIKPWFHIHNPYFPVPGYTSDAVKDRLDALNRLGFRAFRPLVLAAFCTNQAERDIVRLLSAAERYNFAVFTLSQRRSNTGDSEYYGLARRLLHEGVSIDDVIELINLWTEKYFSETKFAQQIQEKYELGRQGFYHWDGIQYFLYEYEIYLQKRGKQAVRKLKWHELTRSKKEHVTVEHIYPQTKTPYWEERFERFTEDQKRYLTHSLGNLVPLSRAKNSSLQNDPFEKKKNNGSGVGYYNGSVAENEIAQMPEWGAEQIINRGMELLRFMEKRWGIQLQDESFKKNLLLPEAIGAFPEAQSEVGV